MSGQLDELSREDLLKSDAYKEFSSGKPDPAKEAKASDDAPRPDKPSEGREVQSDGGKPDKPASEAAGKVDKPRDEAGKFAPAPEPFEGFNQLDPKIQKQFKNLQAEKSRFQNDYAALQGMVPGLQRQLSTLQQQLAAPKETQGQGQKKVDDFLKSEKFKDYAERFPDEAQGIKESFQQTVDQLRSEFADSGKPVNEKLAQLEAKIGEYEWERQNQAAHRELERLNEVVPEWKLIAGWQVEDENGQLQEVSEPGKRVWHPWFADWRQKLPAPVRQHYDQILQTDRSADGLGYVFNQFKRDVQAYLDASGQQRQDAPESDIAERRSEQLRDISPRPSRSGADQPLPQMNGGGGDRAAFLAQYYDKWKAGQKL